MGARPAASPLPPAVDRFFSPQPNVPGKGIVASYGVTFWLLVVGIGIVAGLGGAAFMLLLHTVEHLAWSYHSGTFLDGVRGVSATHRVLVVFALLLAELVWGAVWALDRPLLLYLLP